MHNQRNDRVEVGPEPPELDEDALAAEEEEENDIVGDAADDIRLIVRVQVRHQEVLRVDLIDGLLQRQLCLVHHLIKAESCKSAITSPYQLVLQAELLDGAAPRDDDEALEAGDRLQRREEQVLGRAGHAVGIYMRLDLAWDFYK